MTSVVCNIEGESETYTYANAYFKENSGTLYSIKRTSYAHGVGVPIKDPLKVVINGSPVYSFNTLLYFFPSLQVFGAEPVIDLDTTVQTNVTSEGNETDVGQIFCGKIYRKVTFRSTGNQLTVVFQSDEVKDVLHGFRARYNITTASENGKSALLYLTLLYSTLLYQPDNKSSIIKTH